jgi:hypothetical protein
VLGWRQIRQRRVGIATARGHGLQILLNLRVTLAELGSKVRNTRTGCGSRSGGTATTISSAPISIPAALGKIVGKTSI